MRGLLLRLSAVEQRRSKARSIGLWPAIIGFVEWERINADAGEAAKLRAATAWGFGRSGGAGVLPA